MTELKNAKKLIDNAKNILISPHIRPDGDAIGSLLGLTRGLKKYGKNIICGMMDEFPYSYRVVKGNEKFIDSLSNNIDLAIIVDVGNFDRVSLINNKELKNVNTIVFDHHKTNQGIGTVNVLEFSASSTCEIILEFLNFLNIKIEKNISLPILTGILTDTRFLTTPSASAKTFSHVSKLIDTGITISEIIRPIRQSKTLEDLAVLSKALDSAEFDLEHKLGWLSLTYNDFNDIDTIPKSAWTAGIFGHLINVRGIEITAHFIEMKPNSIIVEFRSFGEFDVGKLAFSLGGGGHKNASGVTIEKTMKETKKIVLKELKALYNKMK